MSPVQLPSSSVLNTPRLMASSSLVFASMRTLSPSASFMKWTRFSGGSLNCMFTFQITRAPMATANAAATGHAVRRVKRVQIGLMTRVSRPISISPASG